MLCLIILCWKKQTNKKKKGSNPLSLNSVADIVLNSLVNVGFKKLSFFPVVDSLTHFLYTQKRSVSLSSPFLSHPLFLSFSPLLHLSIHILKPYITRIKPSVSEPVTSWFTGGFPLCLWVLWLRSRAMGTGIHFWQGLPLTTGVSHFFFQASSLSLTSVNCEATC